MVRPKKTYNLSAVQAELKLKKPQIEIELTKDVSVLIEPPELWPDEVVIFAKAGKLEESSRALLGDEQYDTWKAHGGTNALLNAVVKEHTQASLGESSAS